MSKATTKAAHLVILYELQRTGVLEGMSYQAIADLLDMGHRSTAMRAVRDLPKVYALVEQKRAALRSGALTIPTNQERRQP